VHVSYHIGMLRKLLLRFLIVGVALGVVIVGVPGITATGGIIEFFKMTIVLWAISLLMRPTLKVMRVPIEIATMAFGNIVLHGLALFAFTRYIYGFSIETFWFSGINGGSFLIAPFEIPIILTILISALLLTLTSTLLYWLTK